MRGFADVLSSAVVLICLLFGLLVTLDECSAEESSIAGDILSVDASRSAISGITRFSITIDLDDGRVLVCPVSRLLGGTLYRLYHNRRSDLPRLRETARVQAGRHSGSVVCRGLAMAESGQ